MKKNIGKALALYPRASHCCRQHGRWQAELDACRACRHGSAQSSDAVDGAEPSYEQGHQGDEEGFHQCRR